MKFFNYGFVLILLKKTKTTEFSNWTRPKVHQLRLYSTAGQHKARLSDLSILYTIDHTGCRGCLREIILCNYYYMIVHFNRSNVNSTNLLVVFSMQWPQKRCTTWKNTSHEHFGLSSGYGKRWINILSPDGRFTSPF